MFTTIFFAFLLIACANCTPSVPSVQIVRENGDSTFQIGFRTIGRVSANLYRYYFQNVPFLGTKTRGSDQYQRLVSFVGKDGHERSTVTAPSCPVTNDPQLSGGASCTNDRDCNSVNQGGLCDFTMSAGKCVCANGWGKQDCTYRRISKDLAGGLQIGLVFAGVGGVGNFIIGRTGMAVGQLILMLSYYACCIAVCLVACGLGVGAGVICTICGCAYLAGFIWAIVDGAHMLQCGLTDSLGYALY